MSGRGLSKNRGRAQQAPCYAGDSACAHLSDRKNHAGNKTEMVEGRHTHTDTTTQV